MLDFIVTGLHYRFWAEDPIKNQTGNQNLSVNFWKCLTKNFPRLQSAGILKKILKNIGKFLANLTFCFLFIPLENIRKREVSCFHVERKWDHCLRGIHSHFCEIVLCSYIQPLQIWFGLLLKIPGALKR